MLALKLLGGLALERDDGPLPATALQRRRVTLLALLAVAGPRGATRERVQAALWPESPADRARHALDQLLYSTRRDLGRDAVRSAGDLLQLDGNVVRVDLWAFQEAVRAGDWAAAVAWHAGPLLDGVRLGGDSDREVDAVRSGVRADFHRALQRLALAAESAGDRAGAIHWWRATAATEPLDARVALALVRALAAAGDRAGALRHAALHARLLREELDAEPDAALAALAAQLTAPSAAPAPAIPPDAPPDVPASAPASVPVSVPPPAPAWRTGRGRRLVMAAVATSALVAAGATLRRAPTTPSSGHVVAVLPFRASGGPDAAPLAEGMPILLGTNLDGAGDIRDVDPRALLAHVGRTHAGRAPDPETGDATAAHFGAGLFVLGDVMQAGERLRVTGALYDRTRGRHVVAEAVVEGRTDEVFALVDRLTAALVVGLERGPRGRLARLASATTTSYPALKAYLEGEGAMRAGRYPDAATAFRRATALDTAFALAHYRLAVVSSWIDAGALRQGEAARALRHAGRLAEHERRLLAGVHAEHQGDAAGAEQAYRAVVGRYPDDVETWMRLGEIRFHGGPLRGTAVTTAREAFTRVLALDPGNAEAVLHLARIAALQDEQPRFDSLAARYLALGGPAAQAWQLGVVADFRRGAPSSARRLADLATASDGRLYSAVRNVGVYGDPDDAARVALLMTAPHRGADTRTLGHVLVAYVHAARGRAGAARASLDRAAGIDRRLAFEYGALLEPAPAGAAPTVADSAHWADTLVAAPDAPASASSMEVHQGVHVVARAYALGLRAARAGDSLRAEGRARAVERAPCGGPVPSLGRDLAASIRAHLAARRGRDADALRLLEAAPVRAPMQFSNFSPLFNRAHDRFLRAELLRRAGRHAEAAGWYASIGGDSFFDLPYVAAARRRLAEAPGQGGAQGL